jgi:hypothetical protein
MRGPGDGIGLVRPAQPDQQRTSRVQRNRSVFRREDLISARPRGCFVYESLELWKRPALYGSPERNFSGCAVCENIEGRLVEKAPLPQREALTSAWILERWVLSCQGHGLVCLRAIADADVNGPGLRGWAEGPRAHEPSTLDRRASNVADRERLRFLDDRVLLAENLKQRGVARGVGRNRLSFLERYLSVRSREDLAESPGGGAARPVPA